MQWSYVTKRNNVNKDVQNNTLEVGEVTLIDYDGYLCCKINYDALLCSVMDYGRHSWCIIIYDSSFLMWFRGE